MPGLFRSVFDKIEQKGIQREQQTLDMFIGPEATEVARTTYDKAIEAAVQAIQAGANPEELMPLREVAGGAAVEMARVHNARLQAAMKRGLDVQGAQPITQEQIDQKLASFDAQVQAAIPEPEPQVETLPPEEATQLGFPKGAVVQRKPDGTLSLAFDPSEDMSSLQEKFQALVATGVDEQRALGIAAGRYQVSVNAITDERVVLDLATGEPVGDPLEPKPQGEVPSMIPESVETDVATGAPGVIKNVVNVIGDSIGAGLAFPHAKEATEAIRSIQTFTATTLQAEVPGRPSNFLLERLEALTVAPNSLLQGEEGAKTRFEQTSRLIEGEIARIEIDVLPLELPPNVRVETQLNLTQLKRLKAAYDDLLAGFDATTLEAPEGIPEEVRKVWGFLTPEERELWMAKDTAAKGEH